MKVVKTYFKKSLSAAPRPTLDKKTAIYSQPCLLPAKDTKILCDIADKEVVICEMTRKSDGK